MKFVSPGSLWALVLIPIAYAILIWDEKRRQKSFEAFASRSLWSAIVPEINSKARMQKITLFLLAGVFAIIAMARPQWGTQEEVAKMSGLDIMVVLDISNSMETEDVIPSRLKKAKHFLRTLAERVQGDRLGLVTFAGGASVATPLTTDTEYFLEQLQIQTPKTIPTQGTDIGLGLETAARAMERGAAQSGQGKEDIPSRAIVLISDGEDFEGSAKNTAAALKAQGIRLYVFGVGTEKGGPVPVRDDSGSLMNYKRDRSGKPVVSSFHPDDLVQIAAAAGGRYWNITVDESEVTDLLKDLGALTRGEFSEHRYLVYKERFQYPLAIAVLLLLIEMSLSVRSNSSQRKAGASAALVALALAGAAAGALPQYAQATGIETYQENKKGIEAYKSGKIEEAQKEFGAAQARDPNLPELQYNQGLVHMQQGDTDAAIHDFQEAARGAMKNGQNELLSKNFFNLGSALSKKGDLKNALQSYLAAIGSAKKSGDTQLEQDARKNIELLIQQQKQQKQQQQQNQQQQQQNQQKQDQQQQQQQQQKNQQNQQQQKQQGQNQQDQKNQQKDQKEQEPKQYDSSSSRGKKFESQKLAPEDAERVLSELKNREKDLQGRMKKQNGNYSSQNNDW